MCKSAALKVTVRTASRSMATWCMQHQNAAAFTRTSCQPGTRMGGNMSFHFCRHHLHLTAKLPRQSGLWDTAAVNLACSAQQSIKYCSKQQAATRSSQVPLWAAAKPRQPPWLCRSKLHQPGNIAPHARNSATLHTASAAHWPAQQRTPLLSGRFLSSAVSRPEIASESDKDALLEKSAPDSDAAEAAKQGSQTLPSHSGAESANPGSREDSQAGAEAENLKRGDSGRLSARWLKQSMWEDNAAEAQRTVGELITSWRSRASSFARESALLIYSALIDNTLVVVLEWVKADKLLRRWTPLLERWMANLFGGWYELHDGKRIPLSLVNNTSRYFTVPEQYRPADLPFADLRDLGYDPRVAHMLSLCMKAVYEQEEIIQDLAEHHWGLRYHGYFSTATEATGLYVARDHVDEFIPRTRATMLSSKHGLIIAFRGSEPTNLINLRSSGRITMRPRFDMGRVHDGFHAALFHSDPESGSLYSQLVETLLSADSTRKKPIFLTGHSLGGALAGVFAAALMQKHPKLSARICGIYTFGQPRIGDITFCNHMDKAFPNQLFRIVHAADIITLVPPRFLEYSHFGQEHYLTTLGNHVWEPADVKRARRIETFGFLPLYLYKLVTGLLSPEEGFPRTVYRFFLLFLFPGLSDHWPSDYCGKLGKRLPKEVDAKK